MSSTPGSSCRGLGVLDGADQQRSSSAQRLRDASEAPFCCGEILPARAPRRRRFLLLEMALRSAARAITFAPVCQHRHCPALVCGDRSDRRATFSQPLETPRGDWEETLGSRRAHCWCVDRRTRSAAKQLGSSCAALCLHWPA